MCGVWSSHQRCLLTLEEQLVQELTVASQDFWVCDFGFMQSEKLLKWQEATFHVLLADGMWWSKDESDVNHLCVSVARRVTQKGLGDHVSARHSGVAEDSMQPFRSRSC